MIKIFFQYIILNLCIGVLFQQLKHNFPTHFTGCKMFMGEFINVKVNIDGEEYVLENCEVEHIKDKYAILKYNTTEKTLYLLTNGTDLVDVKGKDEIMDGYFS